ncbi:hypothetical protein [Cellulomonas aerilata]|nr:hypothetical protein [Cellulomonas aerilata]
MSNNSSWPSYMGLRGNEVPPPSQVPKVSGAPWGCLVVPAVIAMFLATLAGVGWWRDANERSNIAAGPSSEHPLSSADLAALGVLEAPLTGAGAVIQCWNSGGYVTLQIRTPDGAGGAMYAVNRAAAEVDQWLSLDDLLDVRAGGSLPDPADGHDPFAVAGEHSLVAHGRSVCNDQLTR